MSIESLNLVALTMMRPETEFAIDKVLRFCEEGGLG
jgi:hypothetical protein